jgi:hypothetical protein
VIQRAVDAARDLGHEWDLVRDGQEGVLAYRRGRGRGYVNATDDVIDGELFETPRDD